MHFSFPVSYSNSARYSFRASTTDIHSLTSRSTVLLKQLTRSQLVKKFLTFVELKGSLPHLQEPTTCPYPESTNDTI